jgi:hypothetical protein
MPHVKPERKTIEKAIKAIASYHAPGKYMLKEGVSFAKPSPGSGRCVTFLQSQFCSCCLSCCSLPHAEYDTCCQNARFA